VISGKTMLRVTGCELHVIGFRFKDRGKKTNKYLESLNKEFRKPGILE